MHLRRFERRMSREDARRGSVEAYASSITMKKPPADSEASTVTYHPCKSTYNLSQITPHDNSCRCTTHATRLPSHSDLKYPPPSHPANPPPFPPTQLTAPDSCPRCLQIPQPPESMPLGHGLNPFLKHPRCQEGARVSAHAGLVRRTCLEA